jgi:glycerophosphoryl diester phosphodiesterase
MSVAPNEFALTMVILLATVVAPLIVLDQRRPLTAGTFIVGVLALLLSFSRSAWFGLGAGLLITLAYAWPSVRRSTRRRRFLRTRADLLRASAITMVTVVVLAIASGAGALIIDTLSGVEPSAAGRGASLAAGFGAVQEYPWGLGLGTAGPRALEFEPRALLTENWHLLFAIQLGWFPALLLLASLALLLRALLSRVVSHLDAERRHHGSPPNRLRYYPAAVAVGSCVAYLAALAGAMFIPALMDLPAALILSAAVAVVVSANAPAPVPLAMRTDARDATRTHDMARIAIAFIAAWTLAAGVGAPWRPAITGIAVTAQKGDTGSEDGYPENTIEAIVQAARKGADAVEIDVQRSAQGTWFAMLDLHLDRTTNERGLLRQATDEKIRSAIIDGGLGYESERHQGRFRVPDLETVMDLLQRYSVNVHLDIKETEPSAHEALAKLVVANGWSSRATINVKSVDAARAVRAVSDEIQTVAQVEYVPGVIRPIPLIDRWLAKHTEVRELPFSRPRHDIEVFVHLESVGVDEVAVLHQARALGAAAFMTNTLDATLAALGRHGDKSTADPGPTMWPHRAHAAWFGWLSD